MKRILVIDDDLAMAETVEEILSDRYHVAVETDNANVLDSYKSFNPDLIILDNWVGQKQAVDIVAELKPFMSERATPVVLFSGHPDISKIAASINANSWLSKPFALNDLYTCISNLIN